MIIILFSDVPALHLANNTNIFAYLAPTMTKKKLFLRILVMMKLYVTMVWVILQKIILTRVTTHLTSVYTSVYYTGSTNKSEL